MCFDVKSVLGEILIILTITELFSYINVPSLLGIIDGLILNSDFKNFEFHAHYWKCFKFHVTGCEYPFVYSHHCLRHIYCVTCHGDLHTDCI